MTPEELRQAICDGLWEGLWVPLGLISIAVLFGDLIIGMLLGVWNALSAAWRMIGGWSLGLFFGILLLAILWEGARKLWRGTRKLFKKFHPSRSP